VQYQMLCSALPNPWSEFTRRGEWSVAGEEFRSLNATPFHFLCMPFSL
jgi:hypothetical protein